MTQEILLLSDMHTFSHWALLHPDYIGKDIRTGNQGVQYIPNTIQQWTFNYWKDMCKKCSNVDAVIINGDIIDGINNKNKCSVGNNDLLEQCNMATMLLQMLPYDVPMYITKGTTFHCGEEVVAERIVAENLGAHYADECIIETCGIRLFVNHHIAHSQYKAGALERKITQLSAYSKYYGDVDVLVFAHNHQFMSVISRNHVAVMTPGWQHKTPYAVDRNLIPPPDIGYVKLLIDDDYIISVDRRGVVTSPFGPPVIR